MLIVNASNLREKARENVGLNNSKFNLNETLHFRYFSQYEVRIMRNADKRPSTFVASHVVIS